MYALYINNTVLKLLNRCCVFVVIVGFFLRFFGFLFFF